MKKIIRFIVACFAMTAIVGVLRFFCVSDGTIISLLIGALAYYSTKGE